MARRRLQHGMLLDSKSVMDNAMSDLDRIRELIPEKLHGEFRKLVELFEDTLCEADVAGRYEETTRTH